jgi:hypothetical protein
LAAKLDSKYWPQTIITEFYICFYQKTRYKINEIKKNKIFFGFLKKTCHLCIVKQQNNVWQQIIKNQLT